jgi:hypothetical protein
MAGHRAALAGTTLGICLHCLRKEDNAESTAAVA